MKKSIIFFAAIAAFFSCSKENPVNEIPTEETFSVELFATAPSGDADTKTTLVDGDGTKFVHWSKGDAIKVLFFPTRKRADKDYAGSNGVFQSEFETETSEKANFKNDAWKWGFDTEYVKIEDRLCTKGVALYPSTAVATSKRGDNGAPNVTELSFILPNTQSAINGNIESELNFSYAEVDVYSFKSNSDNKNATNLTFNNACALIQLTMPTSFEKDVISVTISSNNEVALTGKGNVDMDYWKEVISSPFHVTPEVSETSHTVTLAKADGTPLEAGATYFAVVWPGAHDGLTISFNAADGTVASKSTKAVTLTASKVKPYTFSSALSFETPGPKEYDYIYADGSMGNDPANAVAVIFYNGKPQDIDPTVPSEYSKGLAISLKAYDVKWHTAKPSDYDSSLKYGNANDLQASSVGGYEAKTKWQSHNLVLYTSDYGTRPVGASEWYHGTHKEWNCIFASLTKINEKLAAVNGAQSIPTTGSKGYWIPFYTGSNAWTIYWNGSAAAYTSVAWFTYTGQCNGARPIFAF